uniref:Uncharacterized protein n=1 Tax=Anguilla anguilla TaxID=7936 RepID=A0A0E9SPQ1_ANGAN
MGKGKDKKQSKPRNALKSSLFQTSKATFVIPLL